MEPSARALIDKFRDAQPLPLVVSQLSELLADNDSTLREFEDVIKMDPVLVARLLKLVNSSFYGLLQRVDSISRAVAFLGRRNLHNLVVTETLRNLFTGRPEHGSAFSRRRLWLHSAAVSVCAKMIAERIFAINGDDAYLAGILHDFGLIVEEQVHRASFHQLCTACTSTSHLVEMERAAFATDHCEIGYLLTGDWSMAETIGEAIRDHHLLLDTVACDSLTGILQLAEHLTAQLDYGTLPGTQNEVSPPLLAHIDDNLDEYTILLEDFPAEMSRARELYGGDAPP